MKRIILTMMLIFTSLGMFGTLYVFAYNCGDTWAYAGPDTFTGGDCGGAWTTSQIAKTSHWTIYWVDGYSRTVTVTDFGQCNQGMIMKTKCYPEFHPPYWYQNTSGYAVWDQITRSAVYNSDGGCNIRNEQHHNYQRHACSTAENCGITPGWDGSCPYPSYPNNGMCCSGGCTGAAAGMPARTSPYAARNIS